MTDKEIIKEMLADIEEVFGNSAYIQYLNYQAKENGKENWLSRARKAIQENKNNSDGKR
jgi:predicted secreted protein